MPEADVGMRLCNNLFPVLLPCTVYDITADGDPAHHVVSREAIVAHYEQLQGHLSYIHVSEVKVEGLVEDRPERALFGGRLPLLRSLPLVHQIDLHIGICGS